MGREMIVSFEELMRQNEWRVRSHMDNLRMNGQCRDGLVAMWGAYEKYQPDTGVLATYFNYAIRQRFGTAATRYTGGEGGFLIAGDYKKLT